MPKFGSFLHNVNENRQGWWRLHLCVRKQEYGPFGEVIRSTGPMAKVNPIRFSTKYQDDESDLLYYGYRYYKASAGGFLNRDLFGESGGLNLYLILGNDVTDDVDGLGACGCKCKRVKVTFSPHTIFGNMKIGTYDGPAGQELGSVITIAWTVDGDPSQCHYYLNEPPNGVTGSGPKMDYTPSYGTGGNTVEISQVYADHMGLFPDQGKGKYRIKVNLTQTYTCLSSDGTTVTETDHYHASGSYNKKN